jgi:hypothetical protein
MCNVYKNHKKISLHLIFLTIETLMPSFHPIQLLFLIILYTISNVFFSKKSKKKKNSIIKNLMPSRRNFRLRVKNFHRELDFGFNFWKNFFKFSNPMKIFLPHLEIASGWYCLKFRKLSNFPSLWSKIGQLRNFLFCDQFFFLSSHTWLF